MAAALSSVVALPSSSLSKPKLSISSLFKYYSLAPSARRPSPPSISCTLTRDPTVQMVDDKETNIRVLQRPDSFGRFGKFGGKYVPETLMHALTELESAFHSLAADEDFQVLAERFWEFVCFVWLSGVLFLEKVGCLFLVRSLRKECI